MNCWNTNMLPLRWVCVYLYSSSLISVFSFPLTTFIRSCLFLAPFLCLYFCLVLTVVYSCLPVIISFSMFVFLSLSIFLYIVLYFVSWMYSLSPPSVFLFLLSLSVVFAVYFCTPPHTHLSPVPRSKCHKSVLTLSTKC